METIETPESIDFQKKLIYLHEVISNLESLRSWLNKRYFFLKQQPKLKGLTEIDRQIKMCETVQRIQEADQNIEIKRQLLDNYRIRAVEYEGITKEETEKAIKGAEDLVKRAKDLLYNEDIPEKNRERLQIHVDNYEQYDIPDNQMRAFYGQLKSEIYFAESQEGKQEN